MDDSGLNIYLYEIPYSFKGIYMFTVYIHWVWDMQNFFNMSEGISMIVDSLEMCLTQNSMSEQVSFLPTPVLCKGLWGYKSG